MKFNKHYVVWALVAVVYAVLTVLLPPDASSLTKYSITGTQARLLSLSFVLPYILVWFAAFYGYVQCKAYAMSIRQEKDGQAFETLGKGLMLLAWGMPVGAITGNILNQIKAHHPGFTVPAAILSNYIGLLVVFVAFFVIHRGTTMLTKTLKNRKLTPIQITIWVFYGCFAIAYSYITMSNPARQFPSVASPRAAYYLPDFLLVLTIVVPYVLVWFWGLQSAYQIYLYKNNVKGLIYKNSLTLLAMGIVWNVAAFAFIRFLVSLTSLVNSWALKVILAVLYVFLLMIGIGSLMIAVGAKRMKKIEEV